MTEQELWRNYAEGLLRVAAESRGVDETGAELGRFAAIYDSTEGLDRLLKSPRIRKDVRNGIVDEIAAVVGMSPLGTNFVKLLVDNGRIGFVRQISSEYRRLADLLGRRQTAHLTSAAPLGDSLKERIREVLEKVTGSRLKLEAEVDEGLLGGIVARVGDRLFDGSLRGELKSIRKKLMEGED